MVAQKTETISGRNVWLVVLALHKQEKKRLPMLRPEGEYGTLQTLPSCSNMLSANPDKKISQQFYLPPIAQRVRE